MISWEFMFSGLGGPVSLGARVGAKTSSKATEIVPPQTDSDSVTLVQPVDFWRRLGPTGQTNRGAALARQLDAMRRSQIMLDSKGLRMKFTK